MGKSATLPPDGISIPYLARVMNLRNSAIYEATAKGRGPRLSMAPLAPGNCYKAKRRSHYVTIADAVAWLEARDPTKWADAIRHLRIERILAHVRAGVPL